MLASLLLLWDLKTCLVLVIIFLLTTHLLNTPKNLPPGPLNIPILGATLQLLLSKENFPTLFKKWSMIYGNVFSMRIAGRWHVVLNDYESIKQAMHHPDLQDRPTRVTKLIQEFTGTGFGVSSANGIIWKEQRRFINSHFHTFGILKSSFEDFVLTEAGVLAENIKKFNSKKFDPHFLLSCAAFNIIFRITNGDHFDYSDSYYHELIRIINRFNEVAILATPLTILPFLKHIPYGPHLKLIKQTQEFHNLSVKMVEAHQKGLQEENIKCLLDSYLLQIRKGERHEDLTVRPDIFNEPNLHSTVGALFLAGAETIVTTMRWALLALLLHPQYQKKIQDEIDHVVGSQPKLADRPQLHFLQAVISEVHRWGAVAPLSVPHKAAADINMFGYTIPADALVISNVQAVCMDENIWNEPKKFKPERFLNEQGKFFKRKEVIPFGTGPRQCLGKQLAQTELFIFLTSLFYNFTIKLPEGAPVPDTYRVRGITYKPKPFEIVMVPRR